MPLRTERMSVSPFAFYRGSAALMAADLAGTTHTDIGVAACGDAHLANFGFYASPQRTLVFDLNDFDEAAWAPWEWDLKRLVTSVVVAGRDTSRGGHAIEAAARATVSAYRAALRASLSHTPLQRYYAHIDAEGGSALVDKKSRRVIDAAAASARRRTGERAVRRLTHRDEDGTLRFVLRPPTMSAPSPQIVDDVHALTDAYRRSAAPDIRILLSQYAEVDLARRVVGVGASARAAPCHSSRTATATASSCSPRKRGAACSSSTGGSPSPLSSPTWSTPTAKEPGWWLCSASCSRSPTPSWATCGPRTSTCTSASSTT